ncbi:hypothetical protein DFJ74DRAFT_646981 [Hyaloraphidium curvatum]|nr:hypothetical protein DFJ74DRAFT_646981 [Hyaloraphidium curvatum]
MLVGIIWAASSSTYLSVTVGSALRGRARLRAVYAALQPLMDRAEEGHLGGGKSESVEEKAPATDNDYFALQAALAASWTVERGVTSFIPWGVIASSLFIVVALVIQIAMSSCLPAWLLTYMAREIYIRLRDLYLVADFNAGVNAVCAIYTRAAQYLREQAASLDDPSHPASSSETAKTARYLSRHAEVLSSYASTQTRARFLGFEVGYNTVRAVVGAVLTAGFAAFSVLRAVGVVVTLESVC